MCKLSSRYEYICLTLLTVWFSLPAILFLLLFPEVLQCSHRISFIFVCKSRGEWY